MRVTFTLEDALYRQALEAAGPVADDADLFREAIETYVRVESAKRCAALGGSQPDMQDVPRRHELRSESATTGPETMSTATIRSIQPAGSAPPGGHYAHGTVANGFVFVSGQLPIAPSGEKLVDASFADQARQALANVAAVLEAAGSGIERLVQVRVYVDSLDHWPEFNAVYAGWIGDVRPSRAVVPTGPLHHGLKVELEAVATVP